MLDAIDEIRQKIETEPLDSPEAVEAFRVKYLGRKNGRITGLMKRITEVPPAERPAFGQRINQLKDLAEARLEEAERAQQQARHDRRPRLDLTLPGRRPFAGTLHPITQAWEEIRYVFASFGFSVEEGPEIEDDWHNFTALNFPPDHPARDMQDTFFLEPPAADGTGGVVLRTHTSPVQIRLMEKQSPPLRAVIPGRVYRNEAVSYKSFCLFNQVEGLYVDEGVSLADLKHILHVFAQALFGDDVRMRFRPSFFPFTEPSAEVDIWRPLPGHPEGGQWLEILGCGMVDPNVFEAVGIDPEVYTGYAFGMGIDRVAMLRHGIDDIRVLYENDVRFLNQF